LLLLGVSEGAASEIGLAPAAVEPDDRSIGDADEAPRHAPITPTANCDAMFQL